jgi:hypothetical protein
MGCVNEYKKKEIKRIAYVIPTYLRLHADSEVNDF